jgi:hypothetical protein
MTSLAPYSRQVTAAKYHNVWVCAGRDGWRRAKFRNRSVAPGSALVLPPGDDPHAYHSLVRGLHVFVMWPDATLDEVTDLCMLLIRSGAASVVAPCDYDPEGCLYVKPRRAAA